MLKLVITQLGFLLVNAYFIVISHRIGGNLKHKYFNKFSLKVESVFMKHYTPNYMLASKQSISQIKAKPKLTPSLVTQLHRLSEHE